MVLVAFLGINTNGVNDTATTSTGSERENSNCSGRVNHVGISGGKLTSGGSMTSPTSLSTVSVDLLANIISKTSVNCSTSDRECSVPPLSSLESSTTLVQRNGINTLTTNITNTGGATSRYQSSLSYMPFTAANGSERKSINRDNIFVISTVFIYRLTQYFHNQLVKGRCHKIFNSFTGGISYYPKFNFRICRVDHTYFNRCG